MQSKQTIGLMRLTIAVWAATAIYIATCDAVLSQLGMVSGIALVAFCVAVAAQIGPSLNLVRTGDIPTGLRPRRPDDDGGIGGCSRPVGLHHGFRPVFERTGCGPFSPDRTCLCRGRWRPRCLLSRIPPVSRLGSVARLPLVGSHDVKFACPNHHRRTQISNGPTARLGNR